MSTVYKLNAEWVENEHLDEDDVYLSLEYGKRKHPDAPADAWLELDDNDLEDCNALDDFSYFTEEEKARAFALEHNAGPEEIKEDGNTFSIGSLEYLILTEDEADEEWEERLDSYLEECVLPELPESAQMYFDRDSWKSDARMDGRGHAIASYDGNETDIIDPETGDSFLAFRMN